MDLAPVAHDCEPLTRHSEIAEAAEESAVALHRSVDTNTVVVQ
jgi:hypothetical protein